MRTSCGELMAAASSTPVPAPSPRAEASAPAGLGLENSEARKDGLVLVSAGSSAYEAMLIRVKEMLITINVRMS